MKERTKGNLILLFVAMLWGTGFIAQKLGNEVMPPMAFNAVRQFMAAVVLCPFLAVSLRRTGYFDPARAGSSQLAFRKRRMLIAGLVCGFFLLVGTATQQIGLVTVSAGKSGFISSVYIVIVPVFTMALGTKVRSRQLMCVVLALAGFAVMNLRGGLSGATAGDWWTLASAAGFAAQIVAVNHFLDKDNAMIISVLQMAVCSVMGLVISLLTEKTTAAQLAAGLPALLYSTLIPTAGGYTLQVVGQKYTDSSTAALIMSLEAVFAMIFGMLFLGEMMSAREFAGSAIIFAAVILAQK